MSVDEWMRKMWCIHAREYYSAMRKKKVLPFAITYMNLKGIVLSEIRQRKRNTV